MGICLINFTKQEGSELIRLVQRNLWHVNHMCSSKQLLTDLLDRAPKFLVEFSSHHQFRELLTAFCVLWTLCLMHPLPGLG